MVRLEGWDLLRAYTFNFGQRDDISNPSTSSFWEEVALIHADIYKTVNKQYRKSSQTAIENFRLPFPEVKFSSSTSSDYHPSNPACVDCPLRQADIVGELLECNSTPFLQIYYQVLCTSEYKMTRGIVLHYACCVSKRIPFNGLAR